MKALIDGDICTYRIGFASEQEPYEIAEARMNTLIEKILADTMAHEFVVYLTKASDQESFRKKIYPEYKMNRKDSKKPIHYEQLRDFLTLSWMAETVNIIEADDAMGINQRQDTVICTIDKDLNMIPGLHYNFVKENLYNITEEQAIYNFYKQLLMGDASDNIKGVQGIGEKKAEKILGDCTDEEELFRRVRETYSNDEEMLLNGNCLWIVRKELTLGNTVLPERWEFTKFGSRLSQETNSQSVLGMKQTELGLESTTMGLLTDGFLPNGTNQPDIIESTVAPQH